MFPLVELIPALVHHRSLSEMEREHRCLNNTEEQERLSAPMTSHLGKLTTYLYKKNVIIISIQ